MKKSGKIGLAVLILLILSLSVFYIVFKNRISHYIELYPYIRNFEKDAFTEEYSSKYIYPAQRKIDVQKYSANIFINFSKEEISAKVKILIAANELKDTLIPLNLQDGFNIVGVKCNNISVKPVYKDNHILIPKRGEKDTVKVLIAYKGKPQNSGLGSFVFAEFKNRKYVYTINEPVYASTWLPCNDRPDDKALFEIEITTDSSKVSVSNGKLLSIAKNGKYKTYTWQTLYPVATYLVAVYSGNYVNITDTLKIGNKTLKLSSYVFPEDSQKAINDLKINKDGLKIFSKLFGEYPFIKEKYGVAEIAWPLGGIENQTIVGIGNKFFTGKNFFDDLFIHELAHQWWGNAVTLKSWEEIWLNEGFAVYSTALFNERLYGKSSLYSFLNKIRGKFEQGILSNPKEEAVSSLTYNKGAWFLHMLRNKIGDSCFFPLLRKYFKKFKYKNISTNEFEKAAEKISGENLNFFFNQWLNEKGIPEIRISYSSIKSIGLSHLVELRAEQQGIYKNYKLQLPLLFFNKGKKLKFTKKIKIDSAFTRRTVKIPFSVDSLAVDKKDLLLIVKIVQK